MVGRKWFVLHTTFVHNVSLLGVYAMYAPCILHTRCVFTFACDTLLTVVSRVLLYAIFVTFVRAPRSLNHQRPSARITRQKLCFTWQSILIVRLFEHVHVYGDGGALCCWKRKSASLETLVPCVAASWLATAVQAATANAHVDDSMLL